MMIVSFKKNYIFCGILGSLFLHSLFFLISGVQNRRKMQDDFVIQVPKKKEHERIYFASVVQPQLKEVTVEKKITKKKTVSKESTSTKKNVKPIVPEKKKTIGNQVALPIKKEVIKDVAKSVEKEKSLAKEVEPAKKATIEKKSEKVEKKEVKKTFKKKESKKEIMPATKQEEVFTQESIAPSVKANQNDLEQKKSLVNRKTERRNLFFELAQSIKNEVALHWVPPVTQRNDLKARVQCTVSPAGKIEQVLLVRSSQVMAYDKSVVRAAWKLSILKPLWGTQFLIAFNQ